MLVVGWACGACLEFDLWALNSTLKCFTFLYCLSYLWRDFWVQSHCTAPGVTRNLKTWASWPEALGVTPLFRGLVYFQTGPWVVCLPVIWVLRTPLWAQWLTCVCVLHLLEQLLISLYVTALSSVFPGLPHPGTSCFCAGQNMVYEVSHLKFHCCIQERFAPQNATVSLAVVGTSQLTSFIRYGDPSTCQVK